MFHIFTTYFGGNPYFKIYVEIINFNIQRKDQIFRGKTELVLLT